MKPSKKTIMKGAGAVAGMSILAGTVSYMTTSFLVRTAMDRQAPKMIKKIGALISGTQESEEFLSRQKEAANQLAKADTESVTITSRDGVSLAGHWYPCENPERIIIAMHGWRSSWCYDFGLVADFLHENHCSVLFAEQRGQHDSGGDYMGLGVTERFDCQDWIHWTILNKSPSLPIYLCGVSMGATTVLMAAGLELPENVHGIMADCAFTSADEIWKHIASNHLHIPYHLQKRTAGNLYERKMGVDGFTYSSVDALRDSKTPVLFIHGTDDHFVPVDMTYRNYCACASPKRLLIVPGADHGMSYLVDPESYERTVKNFWMEFDGKQVTQEET